MSKLKCTLKDASDWIRFTERFDDGEHGDDFTWRFAKDWLAMYDLLKEIADCKGIALKNCDGEVLPLKYIENKIRALIGGE